MLQISAKLATRMGTATVLSVLLLLTPIDNKNKHNDTEKACKKLSED
jgi:hypothetical protein